MVKYCYFGQRPINHGPTCSNKPTNTTSTTDSLRVLYTNADQLPNKIDELKQRIDDEKPHIIAITEVNNKVCKLNPEMIIYNIPEFQIFSKNVPENGRGILIYTHSSLKNVVEVTTKSTF